MAELPDMENPQVREYFDRGYFVADDAVEPQMLERIDAALRRCVAKIRSGAVVDDMEAIGVDGPGSEATHIRGLMAPEFGEGVFSEYLLSGPLHRYIRPFFGDRLRLGWVACFAVGAQSYEIGWHRDVGHEERDGSYEVEMEILQRYRKYQIKWHLPLVDDACLWYVPGSQRRYRTDAERKVLINDPDGEIDGAVQLEVKRGQTLFYNGNGIHKGVRPAGMAERLTLTGSLIQHREGDRERLDERYRWRLCDHVRPTLPPKMQEYYDNWRDAVQL